MDPESRITTTFERLFPNVRIAEIKPTTIPTLPKSLSCFTLICVARNCQHSPPCQMNAVALLRGNVCAIVDRANYDGLELMAAAVLAEQTRSDTRHHRKKRQRQNGRRKR